MGRVFNRAGPERLVSGGVWFLLLMVLSGIFWLSWSVIVSRFYGPHGYGIYNTAYSLFSFAWAFIFGGLFQGLIKYGSEYMVNDKKNISHFFSISLKYLTGIGVVLFFLLFAFSFRFKDPIWGMTVFAIALSFLFTGAKDALASIIGSLHQNDQLSMINASRSIVTLISGIIFIILGVPPIFLPLLLVISTIWELLLSIYFLRSRLNRLLDVDLSSLINDGRHGLKGDIKKFVKVFVFGFFISLGITSFNIMKSLDIAIIKLFFDYTNVGIYSAADTASSILFWMTSFSLPVISAISDSFAKNDEKLIEENVQIAVKYPLLIGLPLTLIILLKAKPLILGIYGPEFTRAIGSLQILILGTFMLMFSYNLSSILIGIGRSRVSGVIMLIAAIQYIILLFILVPLYGFLGAALSLTLTGLTSTLLVPYFIWKHLRVPLFTGVPKVLASGALMGTVLYFVPSTKPLNLIVGIVGSVVIFVVVLYLLGYITKEDIKMIKVAGESFR